MPRIHARVTREIEVTNEEAAAIERVVSGSCTEEDKALAGKVLSRLTEGIDSGSYEAGYVPGSWLSEDLSSDSSLNDIEL